MISHLLQKLKLINHGLAAESYKQMIFKKIDENFEDNEAFEALKKLAGDLCVSSFV